MRSFLLRFAAIAAILAPACGQDTVRINNTTKAVISPVPFRVGQSAVDPTAPGNGSIWYDTATNALKARVNGATISLGTTTITGGNTQVMFFDGANTPAGDAGMTYAKTTDTLTVSNLDASIITGDVTVDGDITVGSINLTGPITFPDDVRNIFNPGATVAGLNVGGFAGNPSTPINGDIWYDSVASTLDARVNGVTVSLGASPLGSDNTWTGVNTFNAGLTVGAQIISTQSTGTAPFSVASTTNVANLNASSLNGATITGGGTIALGGFTLTVPATGTLSATSYVGGVPVLIGVAISDETTEITTGAAKVTIRAPYAFTVTAVRSSLNTVSSSGLPTVDINETGTTILSTKLSIDASERTSITAAAAAVISDTAIADDAEITFDIDVAGTGAKGLKVWIIGTR